MPTYRVKSGKHRVNGRTYTKGQKFEAWYIPEGFRDTIECLTPEDEIDPAQSLPANPLEVRHKGGKYYDVVNTVTGQKLNDKGVTKEEAEAMVEG